MSQTVVSMLGSCIVTGFTIAAMSISSLLDMSSPPEELLINSLDKCTHTAYIECRVLHGTYHYEIVPVLVLSNDDDSYYTQVFRNRSQLNAFIDQLRSQADEIWPAEDAFQFWWDNEGSGMAPKPDEETSVHAERIAKIAWANGAYVGCGHKES